MDPCFKLDSAAFLAAPELIEALKKRASSIVCDEDRVLFRQGEPSGGVYILHKGDAFLKMQSNTGEPVMCMQTFAGSLLGLPSSNRTRAPSVMSSP